MMNTVISCLLIVTVMPIVCSWVSGYFRHKQLGVVDNKAPRLQNAELTGAGHRACAAQQNCWEALGMFVAALLALQFAGVAWESVVTLCIAFAVCRVIYMVCYLANQDAIRSIAFLAGFGICMYFFYLALSA